MEYKLRCGAQIDIDHLSQTDQDLIYGMHDQYEQISSLEAEDKWGHFEWVTYTTIDDSIRNDNDHPVELIRRDLLRNLMIQCGMVGEPSDMFVKKGLTKYSSKLSKTP